MLLRVDRPLIGITLLSALFCVALWRLTPINFYADSEQYLRTAFALVYEPGEFYYYRTWGYPIAFILSGVTKYHTFRLLLLVQALLGIAIPVLIYKTIQPFNQRVAIIVAVLSTISFAPFLWQKTIMSDQISIFLYYLLALGATRFVFNRSNTNLGIMWVSGFLLLLMRPSAMFIYFCTMGCLLIFYRNEWRRISIVVIGFVALSFLFQQFQDNRIDKYYKRQAISTTYTKGSMIGRMFFFNVYAVGPVYSGTQTIDPTNGKYSAKLYDDIVQWGIKNPMGINSYMGVQDPTEFANKLLAEPNLFTHSVMWLVMDQTTGAMRADKIFARAAIEGLVKHPKASLLFFNGFLQFFMGGDVVYHTGKPDAWNANRIASDLVINMLSSDPDFSKVLLRELSKDKKRHLDKINVTKGIYKFIFYWQTGFKIVATIIVLLLLPVCLYSDRRLICITTLFSLYLIYQAAVAVTFASPHFRYISPQIPLIIMLAGLVVYAFSQLRTNKQPT